MIGEKLQKLDKAKVKAWIRDSDGSYDIISRLMAEYAVIINNTEITGENAFQTLKQLHTQKGKVDGVTEFFNEIERLAE